MPVITIVVGSNTEELSTLQLDTEARTLAKTSSVYVGSKPSWVTPHPRNKYVVYTALKIKEAKLLSLEFDSRGVGRVVGEVSTRGDSPSSLVAGSEEIVVGNYDDATIFTIRTIDQMPYMDADSPRSTQVIQLVGNGPHPTRQAASHPHQVVFAEGIEGELFIPDLGSDTTWRLVKKSKGNYRVSGNVISSPPGSGPRHLDFFDAHVYILHELGNTISSFDARVRDPTPSCTRPSTLLFSRATKIQDAVTAGEILIPRTNSSFPIPLIYVSNRYDSRLDGGDTITIFQITDPEEGEFEYITEVETNFKQLRAMQFIGEDDRWLIAGGVFAGGVKVFERVQGGRGLKLVIENYDVELPTCFLELGR